MTVAYTGIAIYGLWFGDYPEAKSWLESHNIDSYSLSDDYEETPTNELLITTLNAFTGDGCVVGYKFILGESIERYAAQWAAVFPPEPTNTPTAFIDVLVV
jgi:hypothetical protein